MDIKNDYNLRENADIVALAMDASKSLDSTQLKEYFEKKYSSYEIRVYLIRVENLPEELEDKHCTDLSDEEFMDEAERQGYVYSLDGFESCFNNNDQINQNEDWIRFLHVPVSK